MRNLAFTSDSPQSVKLGDSNDTLSLRVTELNQPVDLSKASSITVKIGNTSGFLTDIKADVSSLKYPTDGRIDVVINSELSNKLPAGQYLIEVWIDDAQGNTIIYPDTSYPSVIGFSIEKNIMTATTVITTLTLYDFEVKFDDMQKDLQDKVTSGYFKGDKGDPGEKGDTGTVDNAGLISAPAFQSLQTQVNNSAVGTNLLTTDFSRDLIVDDPSNASEGYVCATVYNSLIAGSVYTFSSEVSVLGTATSIDVKPFNPTTGSTIDDSYTTFSIVDGKISGLVKPTNGYTQLLIYAGNKGTTPGNKVTFNHMKLEKGSKATDWCPNPSEILTQSDYAKIKAAIVALGGTLS